MNENVSGCFLNTVYDTVTYGAVVIGLTPNTSDILNDRDSWCIFINI